MKKDFYLAYRWSGIAYHILGNYDLAIENFKIAGILKPYSEEPLMHLEMTYRKKGDFEEAKKIEKEYLKVGEKKLEISPDDTIALSRIAGVYASKGDKEKAIQAIKKIIDIDPEDGLAIYNCACNYARMNMKKEALQYLQVAFKSGYKNVRDWIKSDPDFDSIRDEPEFKKIVDVNV